jgi:hypothetical protein
MILQILAPGLLMGGSGGAGPIYFVTLVKLSYTPAPGMLLSQSAAGGVNLSNTPAPTVKVSDP